MCSTILSRLNGHALSSEARRIKDWQLFRRRTRMQTSASHSVEKSLPFLNRFLRRLSILELRFFAMRFEWAARSFEPARWSAPSDKATGRLASVAMVSRTTRNALESWSIGQCSLSQFLFATNPFHPYLMFQQAR